MSGAGHTVLAFDPGREKCGFALVNASPVGGIEIIRRGIVRRDEAVGIWRDLAPEHPALTVVLGNGTGSQSLCEALALAGGDCVMVEERFTTRRARDRYFLEQPPRGWRRLIPRGLLTPPCPVDDLAATILAEEWLAAQDSSSEAAPPLRSGLVDPQNRAGG
ncbi:MAG TPA: hypothetical protein VFJ58_19170 [Armatimonadota bacterium]|nr:hypothetical protein [Armatimonadota bacterium]